MAHKLHHWGFSCYCHPRCNHGVPTRLCRPGGGERDLPRRFWKDVWNRSMGIKRLGSVGGPLCWRWSPLLASMISSIDIEALLRSLFLFLLNHPFPCWCLTGVLARSKLAQLWTYQQPGFLLPGLWRQIIIFPTHIFKTCQINSIFHYFHVYLMLDHNLKPWWVHTSNITHTPIWVTLETVGSSWCFVEIKIPSCLQYTKHVLMSSSLFIFKDPEDFCLFHKTLLGSTPLFCCSWG